MKLALATQGLYLLGSSGQVVARNFLPGMNVAERQVGLDKIHNNLGDRHIFKPRNRLNERLFLTSFKACSITMRRSQFVFQLSKMGTSKASCSVRVKLVNGKRQSRSQQRLAKD